MRKETNDTVLGDRGGQYKSPQKQHVVGPVCVHLVVRNNIARFQMTSSLKEIKVAEAGKSRSLHKKLRSS